MKKIYFLPFLLLALSHCASSTSTGSPSGSIIDLSQALDAADLDINPDSLVKFKLTYSIETSLIVKDDENSPYTSLSENLVFPFYVDINTKTAYMLANEFPSFTQRVCASEDISTDCDFIYEGLGDNEMLDIVFDSCGDGLSNSKCGPKYDDTLFSGEFDLDTGSFDINNVAIRVRVFKVTDSEDGSTAKVTDDGYIKLDRINAALSTNSSVGGSPFNSSGIVILGAKGVIPDSFSELAGASYTAIVTGTISPNPFDDE